MDGTTTHITVMQYRGAMGSCIYGLVDLFDTANAICVQQGIEHNFELCIAEKNSIPKATTIAVVPPSIQLKLPAEPHKRLNELLHSCTENNCKIVVIGNACKLLEPDFLGEKHNNKIDLQQETAIPDNHTIKENDIILTQGVYSWLQLGVAFIAICAGQSVADKIAVGLQGSNPRAQASHTFYFLPRLDHGDALILQAQQYIHTHYNSNISLSTLSALTGLHERTLQRRFLKATDFGIRNYLQHVRIKNACALLLNSNTGITVLADKAGFSSNEAFAKAFKKIIGMAPQEFIDLGNHCRVSPITADEN